MVHKYIPYAVFLSHLQKGVNIIKSRVMDTQEEFLQI